MSAPDPSSRLGGFGEPAPRLVCATSRVERYALDVAAGRWLLLLAFGSAGEPACAAALETVRRSAVLFDDARAAFFGLSIDPADRDVRGLADVEPGIRFFWDFDRSGSAGLGLIADGYFRPRACLIDPMFRIVETRPVEEVDRLLRRLETELGAASAAAEAFAPVLVAPRIFEPELCRSLTDLIGGATLSPSGFSQEVEGRTVQRLDPRLKRRADLQLDGTELVEPLERRLRERLLPLIETAFAWRATRIERFLLCRYGAEDAGFFSAHRDNVTSGTAHRRFAVSVNLNDGYEGGELRFPEFGPRLYRPPVGGACVFACGLLHEVTPVRLGARCVFAPFLYDEEGERVRADNLGRVEGARGSAAAWP